MHGLSHIIDGAALYIFVYTVALTHEDQSFEVSIKTQYECKR